MKRIAVVRVRGKVDVKKKIKDTLKMLRLYKANYCVVIKNNEIYLGMLKKTKDYISWGEINEETFKMLLEKRGRLPGNKLLTENYLKEKLKLNYEGFIKEFFEGKKELKDIPGLRLFFRLKPPERGHERGGVKKPFSMGGALGYRKEKINDLIKRMI